MIPLSTVVAELNIPLHQLSLSDLSIILGIGGSLGAGVMWLFSAKYVAKEVYERDKAELDKRITDCNQSLQLSQQASASLESAVKQLTIAIDKNTETMHALDKRLAVVEAHQHKD